MAKVITFSRRFLNGHPRAGKPTFFVEKIYKSLFEMKCVPKELAPNFNFAIMNDDKYPAKNHTIRSGKRFKDGEMFSPRIWLGRPYASKQFAISSDVRIIQVYDYEYKIHKNGTEQWFIDGKLISERDTLWHNSEIIKGIAKNDGLELNDFLEWFPTPFEGQIICWNDVNYL